jgi:SAM-dependent methyltransferase
VPGPEPGAGFFARDEGRRVFGTAAAAYATARPGYPQRVYDILRERCGLGPSSRVLEIGAGAGQATVRLVELAGSVVAIEPSDALAGQLRARVGAESGLEIVGSAFEDADLPPASFDLVASATAFHWLEPDVALPKVASLLRPDGWLAIWWNVFGDPQLPDPFHDATEPLLRDLETSPGGHAYALDVDDRVGELAAHGFRDVEHEPIHWTLTLDAARTRQLYATFSNIARLPDLRRAAILDEIERIAAVEFGGRVERRMVTAIYTARR